MAQDDLKEIYELIDECLDAGGDFAGDKEVGLDDSGGHAGLAFSQIIDINELEELLGEAEAAGFLDFVREAGDLESEPDIFTQEMETINTVLRGFVEEVEGSV